MESIEQMMKVTVAVFALVSAAVLYRINDIQPKPYMDEIFHVRQAQHFCDGNFTVWDPMITTLPGLYLISTAIMKPAMMILHEPMERVCTTFNLRLINLVFSVGIVHLLQIIYNKIHTPHKDDDYDVRSVMTSLVLATFPVLYFFTFLFYTDQGSTCFVLLMYTCHLYGYKFTSAVMGIISIFFRQTNLVWVVFMVGLSASTSVVEWTKKMKRDKVDVYDISFINILLKLLFTNFIKSPQSLIRLSWKICIDNIWYILTIVAFLVFVYVNNGIVVGDRSQHHACLNFPQLFYFISFAVIHLSPYLITPSRFVSFILYSVKHIPVTVAFFAIGYIMVDKYTYVHLYLLSDNRHYTFYVWSKIYERSQYIRYILIPCYHFGAYSLLYEIRHKDSLWKLTFLVCVLGSTVPQKLLEFRYFIIPYLIYRLNVKFVGWKELFLEMIIYTLINVFTLYMFLYKPFHWGNSIEQQRFMW